MPTSKLPNFYPASCHHVFFEHYGKVDSDTWRYARFAGLYIMITLMLYAYDTGNKTLLNETIASLKSNFIGNPNGTA